MRPGLVEIFIQLYPRSWRERYGAEFAFLLEQEKPTFANLLNILICALSERFQCFMEVLFMHSMQRALPALFAAWFLAVAAGINLWASVDDNPLVEAMRSHASFMDSWMIIEAGSLLGVAAVASAGVPLLIAMFKQAQGERRRQLFRRLLILFAAAAIPFLWMGAVLLLNGGHWAPMPWAITGDWMPASNWPSLTTRWIFGTTTLVLLLAAGCASAIGFDRMVQLAAFPNLQHRRFRVSILVLAIALNVMAAGTGLWGLFANQYSAAIFHAKFGGLLNLSTFSSWLLSFTLFVSAAGVAIRGARQYSSGVVA